MFCFWQLFCAGRLCLLVVTDRIVFVGSGSGLVRSPVAIPTCMINMDLLGRLLTFNPSLQLYLYCPFLIPHRKFFWSNPLPKLPLYSYRTLFECWHIFWVQKLFGCFIWMSCRYSMHVLTISLFFYSFFNCLTDNFIVQL